MRARRPEVFWRRSGSGPALVLLNGWSASGLAWPRAWVRELERDFTVVRVDNRGSGSSRFAATPFTMEDLGGDVVAVLDDAEIDRATLLGMSMGGMIAQEVAFQAPDRVAGLVLVATRPPAPRHTAPPATAALWGLMSPPARGESLEGYLLRVWSSATAPGFAESGAELLDELVASIAERPTPRSLLVHQLRAVNGWGHAERLERLDVPAGVLHGTEDPMLPVENGRTLAASIPGATYVELQGIGHLPPLEAPEAVLDLVAAVTGRTSVTQPS